MLTQKEAENIALAAIWRFANEPYFMQNVYALPWGWIFYPVNQKNVDKGLPTTIDPAMVDKFTGEVLPLHLMFANDFSTHTILKEYALSKGYEWQDEIYPKEHSPLSNTWSGQVVREKSVLEADLDYKTALGVVENILLKVCTPDNPSGVFEDYTIILPWGWLFFYNTIYPTDEKPWDYNMPIMIDRHNGMCYILNMFLVSGTELSEYAQKNGYDYDPAFWTDEYEMRCIEILEFWES